MLTGILIGVQVVASSQSEAEARHAASGCPRGSQLLAQRQAPCRHVSVAIEDQHSAAVLLSTERTADRHVCSGEGIKRRRVMDLGWLRCLLLKRCTAEFIFDPKRKKLKPKKRGTRMLFLLLGSADLIACLASQGVSNNFEASSLIMRSSPD